MHSTEINEIWRPVIGFESYYMVSSYGNVKSIPNKNKFRPNQSQIIRPGSVFGYLSVVLSINNKHSNKRVHRLVAEAFIENTENKPCVNHINGIKNDNRLENLEWVTYSENERHSYDVLNKNTKGVKKTFKNGINPKCKRILCIEKNITFKSVKDAADSLNLSRPNINKQINGSIKRCGGYTFMFV